MDKSSLITHVRAYLIFRRVFRILGLTIIPCLVFFIIKSVGWFDLRSFLKCCEIVFYIWILLELFNILYKFAIYESLEKIQSECLQDFKYQERQSKYYKSQLDDPIMYDDKSKDELYLRCLEAKVQLSIAHMWLKKINILENSIKKWW